MENRATLEKSKERNISGEKSGADESNKKKGEKGKRPKGLKLEKKRYSPRIFRLLSQEQQDQLREWNEKKGKRKVATLKKQIKEELKSEMKRKGHDKESEEEDESSVDDAAGKEFGRGAHKKRSKKDNA